MDALPINMRRTILIAAVIIVLGGLGVWAYFQFFRSSSPAVVVTDNATLPAADTGVAPAVGTGTGPATPMSGPAPVTARLIKVTAGPVVPGIIVVTKPAANASSTPSALVSFVERRSGNIYTYSKQTNTLTRTNNRTIPSIQSASWLPDASRAFVRYLSGTNFETINTYSLSANGGDGSFLSQNISDLAVSSSTLLLLASGVNGSVASISRTDGSKSTQAFTTSLSSLRIGFAGKNKYLAFTKPSSTLPGAAFVVDGAGRFTRIAGPLPGLVALASPSGAWVLVSYTVGSTLQMELVNAQTGEALPLPVATIADKCVWSADSVSIYCGIPVSPSPSYAYPDDWYQGAVSFSDRLWKIQVSGRYAQLVLDFNSDTGSLLDAESLAVDAPGTTLVFVNKLDGSLWSFSL